MPEDVYEALGGDLTAVFHFDVEELNVRVDLLGQALSTSSAGRPVQIDFPNTDGRFRLQLLPSERPIVGRRGEDGTPQQVYVIRLVQLHVALGRGLGNEGSGNAEYVLLREALPVATTVVRGVLDWARTQDRQVWLLPTHVQPSLVGPAWLINAAGERTHGYPLRQRGAIVLLEPDQCPRGDLAQALDGTEIPQAESLLAEARWAVWPTQDPDTKRAVLLAAIALEVKTPQVLQAMATGPSEKLLRALFDRPDESRLSANFQLNAIADALGGGALKQHDGKLAKRVTQVFKLRNDVAHRGITPEVDEARQAVAAAEQAFSWLDERLAV